MFKSIVNFSYSAKSINEHAASSPLQATNATLH